MEVCDQSLQTGEPYETQAAAVQRVWQEIGKLDIEAHEANRYYSLGLVTCAFMRPFLSEEGRASFIETAANNLIQRHRWYCIEQSYIPQNKGLYVGELRVGEGAALVPALDAEKYTSLNMTTRLLANTLMLSARADADREAQTLPDSLMRRVLNKDQALETVAKNSLAGAMIFMKLALLGYYARVVRGDEVSIEDVDKNLAVREMADEATIAQFELTMPAIISASLRMDEMRDIRRWIRTNTTGALTVDRAKIPRDPGPVRQNLGRAKIKHTKRLRCPALYVDEAIPLVAQAAPQIVNKAQDRLLPA